MKILTGSFLLSVFALTTAHACIPVKGEHYDTFPDRTVLVGIADVTSVAITSPNVGESCLSTTYTTQDSIQGEMPGNFEVHSCVEETLSSDVFEGEFISELGFVEGATIVLGVVKTDASETSWRYAVPSCWGPFHLRMDTLSDDERLKLISSIDAQINADPSD